MEGAMMETLEKIRQFEEQIEGALRSLEMTGKIEEALAAYQHVEAKLEALGITAGYPVYAEYQRVLAYCLMRQGNLLRQLGQPHEAMSLSEREIAAARASGDQITLARSLMSNGTNQLVAGHIERGVGLLDEARSLFESGDSYDHRQGLGWYWVLQADLLNAGLVPGETSVVIDAADRALALLLPIENWPGVARAYAARAQAHERQGDSTAASADQEARQRYEGMVESTEDNTD
jgi:tetratricopeptide (TPR) repeat protein